MGLLCSVLMHVLAYRLMPNLPFIAIGKIHSESGDS